MKRNPPPHHFGTLRAAFDRAGVSPSAYVAPLPSESQRLAGESRREFLIRTGALRPATVDTTGDKP